MVLVARGLSHPLFTAPAYASAVVGDVVVTTRAQQLALGRVSERQVDVTVSQLFLSLKRQLIA